MADENENTSLNDVTRLQLRESNFGSTAWSQSTFIQFPNKFYFLDLYDHQYNTSYQLWHLDMNIGQPLLGSRNDIIDWALRSQTYHDVPTVLSAGLQFNLTNIASVKNLISNKIQSFIQIFPIKNRDNLGRLDIVHYYSIPLSQKVSLRGYNQYIIRSNQSNLFYPWTDFIYSVNKKFDVYERTTYLSSHDAILGNKGFTFWLGIRMNFFI